MSHSLGFMLSVFASFLVGSGITIWERAAHTVNSKLNGIGTYGDYFKLYGSVQAGKTFFALCFLLLWLYHQTTVEEIVSLVWHGGVVPQWLQGVLVVDPATAGMFGLGFEVLENFAVVYLKKKWPGIAPEVPPTPLSASTKSS